MKNVFLNLLACFLLIRADLYMHSPPGSNNRNRERKDNRNNANRLFDSQNNGKGGYPWRGDATVKTADPLTYYVGSKLRIEWTVQHSCGANPNIHCELVIQAGCSDSMPALRDGYPQSNNCWDSNSLGQGGQDNINCGTKGKFIARKFQFNNEGTSTIPVGRPKNFYSGNTPEGLEYGMHENYTFYETCTKTSRNYRLYTSDQKLKGKTARFTRQNPNGGRRGLECPEERDYYPYWRPQPWIDIAVLTSDISFCDFFTQSSQNTNAVGYCDCKGRASGGKPCPITEKACEDFSADSQWKIMPSKGVPPPECMYHPFSRDNHLGNTFKMNDDGTLDMDSTDQPETAWYDWTVPEWATNQQCVIRMRYNMSTKDYNSHSYAKTNEIGVGYDSSYNCPFVTGDTGCSNGDPDCNSVAEGDVPACYSVLTRSNIPLQNRPYVNLFDDDGTTGTAFKLGLAINTHQTGRTFQDRSYVFNVNDAPKSGNIINLGLRGRRGNIVQAYPAVEYDFTPSIAHITEEDWLHIQLHGSDFNAAKNANNGEGWKFSDRSNIVQMDSRNDNYPSHHSRISMFSEEDAMKWAWLGQPVDECLDIKDFDNGNKKANDYNNCGKLNRAPNRFPQNPEDGLVKIPAGTHYYYSSRNNNFSNRAQKAQLNVAKVYPDPRKLEQRKIQLAFAIIFVFSAAAAGVAGFAKAKGLCCFQKKTHVPITGL
ncbi:hypothetical protein AAMO2058_000678800 [Amorphochlora amoebiformis]